MLMAPTLGYLLDRIGKRIWAGNNFRQVMEMLRNRRDSIGDQCSSVAHNCVGYRRNIDLQYFLVTKVSHVLPF
jgi:hypothetical protein